MWEKIGCRLNKDERSVRIIIGFSVIGAILYGNFIRRLSTDLQSYKLARTDFYPYWVTGAEARIFKT